MFKDACLGGATLDGGRAQLRHLQATQMENAPGCLNNSLIELTAPASLDPFNFSDHSYSKQN